MKTKIYIMLTIVAIILSFLACGESEIKVGQIYNYDFTEGEEFNHIETIKHASIFIYLKVNYKRESTEYWKLPEETWHDKNGDCEDFCILFMYVLEKHLNIDTKLVTLYHKTDPKGHTMVYANGKFWEPSSNTYYNSIPSMWYINHFIPYPETIWMTYWYHRDVGMYY